MLNMAKERQNFELQQIRVQRGTALRTTVPVRRIVKKIKPKKTQTQESQEIQQLQQQIKALKTQLVKLQQELEAKK